MGINLTNFLSSKSKNKRNIEFQDLDHLDGLAISTVSANLYEDKRDDLAMFYFRSGANYASVYTQSKIISENIKWNLSVKSKKIYSLIVNTRNANCFTGKQGFKSLEKIADITSEKLSDKQKKDEDFPKKIKSKEIIFGCTGTIGEIFPEEEIKTKIPDLVNNIKYTQNKYIWIKAALGMMTTDTQPKMAMEECLIGSSKIKIFGSGRTDSGVHARGQVSHIDLERETDANEMREALNSHLKPHPIAVIDVLEVSDDFHARFSAKSRIYEYKILIRRAPLALHKNRYWHLNMIQNIQKMKTGARFLIGTHDFTTFRAADCQSNTAVKTLDSIEK